MNPLLIDLILKGITLAADLAPKIFTDVAKVNELRKLTDDFQADLLRLTGSAHADNADVKAGVEEWRKEHGF